MKSNLAEKLGTVLESRGLQTIGALVLWTLSGVRIARETLAQELEALGLGAAMPRAPRPYSLLSDAVRRVAAGKKGVLFRRSGKAWGIVLEIGDVDGQGRKVLRHIHVATLSADDAGVQAEWLIDDAGAFERGIAHEIEKEFVECRDFMHTIELSEILVTCMNGTARDPLLSGLSLRERAGGIYFLHARKIERMRDFAVALRRLSPGSQIVLMTINGDADNLEQAATTAKASVMGRLAELKDEIQEFQAHLRSKEKSADDRNIEVRAERFRLLEGQVDLFQDVLGDVHRELKTEIESARVKLLAELGAA